MVTNRMVVLRLTHTQRARKETKMAAAPTSAPETALARAPFFCVWVALGAAEDEEAVEEGAAELETALPDASLLRAELISLGNWMGAWELAMSMWPSADRMSGFMAKKARVYMMLSIMAD